MSGAGRPPADSGDPFEVFRPRRGRFVAIGLTVAALTIFTTVGLTISPSRVLPFHAFDRGLIVMVGVLLSLLFWRYATIKAVPSREGLVVRNLFRTTTVTWPQVVGLQFEFGMPWPTLFLSDTETLAVMAIQRSDGPYSLTQASRLAALVTALGESPEGGARQLDEDL